MTLAFPMQSWYMTLRALRTLWRHPAWIAVTLVQPAIWLLIFGALFKKVIELPGFPVNSYVAYLTPGVIMMTSFFTAGWSGFPMVEEMNDGVVDRFLVSPVNRGSIITGRVLQQAVTVAIQAVIIVGLALADNATFKGGVAGVAITVAISAILAIAFAALSTGLAIATRQEETVAATVNLFLLPLAFLSTAFLPKSLVPNWIETISKYNPLNWAVEASREVLTHAHPDWGLVLSRTGYLAAFAIAAVAIATRAFRTYQSSI